MWYVHSSLHGNKDAMDNIKAVEDNMSSAQLNKAQEMARNWQSKTWDELKGQLPN